MKNIGCYVGSALFNTINASVGRQWDVLCGEGDKDPVDLKYQLLIFPTKAGFVKPFLGQSFYQLSKSLSPTPAFLKLRFRV